MENRGVKKSSEGWEEKSSNCYNFSLGPTLLEDIILVFPFVILWFTRAPYEMIKIPFVTNLKKVIHKVG
jgi:hypothetical protein